MSFESGIAMIEVKNDDVGLAAVDACMSPEVLADQGSVLIVIPTDPHGFLPDVRGAISNVMLAPVLRVTDPTAPLASPLGLVIESEIGNRLHEPAVIATLGLAGGDRHKGPLRSGSALRSA